MKFKAMILAAFAALNASVAFAQTNEDDRGVLNSWTYVELQGGGQMTLTDAKMDKLFTPVGAFSVGHYFTPEIGARLHANALQAKSGFEPLGKYYKWNYVTTDLDLLLNLTNIFSKKKDHFLNVILLGGIGLSYGWHNNDLKDLMAQYNGLNTDFAWDDHRYSHNVRAGLRLETNVTKPVGVSLEIAANNMDDRFNSKYNNSDDWMITAMLGVSVRFGRQYKTVVPVSIPVVQEVMEDQNANVAAADIKAAATPAPKTVPAPVPVTIHEEIFYDNNKFEPSNADLAKLEKIAKYMKDNPEAKLDIVGYANKDKASAEFNRKISEKRAARVKDLLVSKYGADANRISVVAKGDSVQPFSVNDRNRVSIIDGTTQK